MNELWPDIHATKLEAARRQLDSAIRLLFSGEDAISVHTLAFAAFGLLKDLSKVIGSTKTLRRLEGDAKLREGKKFWRDLHRLANFLKHADRDRDAIIEGVPEEINEAILLVDCFLLRELDDLSSPEVKTLWLWHHAIYFIDIHDAPPIYEIWIDEIYPLLHSESRMEKIKIGAKLLAMVHDFGDRNHRMEPAQILLPWRQVIHPTIDLI